MKIYDSFPSPSRPEAAVSVSGWETVRDELEETKNVSGNMTIISATCGMVKVDKPINMRARSRCCD